MGSFDPLCRIFGDARAPISGIRGPTIPREAPLPHFERDAKTGIATPVNFDNDRAIEVYEEVLKGLVDAAGMTHPGVQGCADGLALLYELKAGVEKDVTYYDKAIEYLNYANTSREKIQGRAAQNELGYKENERLIGKIQRKKERRLAKATPMRKESFPEEPSPRVIEVRLVAGGKMVFYFDDGSNKAFNKPGARNVGGLSELSGIDDDLTETFTAPPFVLKEGEFIVGIITHEKQQKGDLNALCFHTSSGRRSQWFVFNAVEPRGREYSYWASKDHHVAGLKADNGNIAVPCALVEGKRLTDGDNKEN